ncbi:hypothetical protein [Thauera aminoaromatica]|uniref:hypothetical protein n=1 Tax=Thauera aminoaromatica TaxID=164330 RepID=UPI0023573525|nr:hypothetical protein [Thauera aminoaromatica]MCK6398892.1 hypothetical protein [Thauera aminoaromatica]
MIPSDLAARLRTLTEASFFETEPPVPGLQRAREIQARLPELVPGQRFLATLQRTLPDGSFRAVVAGQQMTLALDGSAKAGDTLELEVTQLTPRTVFARVVGGEAATTAGASAQPALSQTGRLISFLLTGQPVPSAASLAGNRPLLDAPPTAGSQLVPVLRQALGQSGLFYESHQVQWVLGKLETAALLREPQGQAGGANTAGGGAGASAGGAAAAAAGGAAGHRDRRPGRRNHGRNGLARDGSRLKPQRRRHRGQPQRLHHRTCRPRRDRSPPPRRHSRAPDAGGAPAARRARHPAICLAGPGLAGAELRVVDRGSAA